MSRITFQAANERNYHVFYQLVAGAMNSPDLKQRWLLERHETFEYINQSGCYTLDGVNDIEMFEHLRRALIVLNVSDEMSDGIFSVVSAVLWIGNFQFEGIDDGEASRLTSKDYGIAEKVAKLLRIKTDHVVQVATHRQILVRGQITEIPLKLHEVCNHLFDKRHCSCNVKLCIMLRQGRTSTPWRKHCILEPLLGLSAKSTHAPTLDHREVDSLEYLTFLDLKTFK